MTETSTMTGRADKEVLSFQGKIQYLAMFCSTYYAMESHKAFLCYCCVELMEMVNL